jgi:hypothetical protein
MKHPAPRDPVPRYGLTPIAFVCGGMWVTIGVVVLLSSLVLRILGWLR